MSDSRLPDGAAGDLSAGPEYSKSEAIGDLYRTYREQRLHRPLQVARYEAGETVSFEVTGVAPARKASVRLCIEAFVGGGFAGQVYRCRVLSVNAEDGAPEGLVAGGVCALKIMRPPSRVAQRFRDGLYGFAFQSAFAPRANPNAARAGALWQKLIRRGARIRLGDERAIVDIIATFVDPVLGSCGEISEWVSGRVWRFEVNDRLFGRGKRDGGDVSEFTAKRAFMADIVRLLHDMGAPELARQYEWWSMKSQPNCLKRLDSEDEPGGGLTAVDFRAGLALLPFLPMSPVDIRLIFAGLARGSLTQFDRGSPRKLRRFIATHAAGFADLEDAVEELERSDRAYRDGQVDIAHHHLKLVFQPWRWRAIRQASVESWRIRGIVDERTADGLRRNPLRSLLFSLLGLLPLAGIAAGIAVLIDAGREGRDWLPAIGIALGSLLAGSILGGLSRRLAGRAQFRAHYRSLVVSPSYLGRTLRGRVAEKLVDWCRAERVTGERARRIAVQPWRYVGHLPLSFLPVFVHRALTDTAYARGLLAHIFLRPVRLYFNPEAREAWLRQMIEDGRRRRLLTDREAERIGGQIGETFIQKYLKCLAVHVCTLPVTQVVSIAVAIWYVQSHPELSWAQSMTHAGLILAAFQLFPISPGSLVRGSYVLWLMISERNYRDYRIAVMLSFFKYVGYLAFPIQMAFRYPALARFMASYWSTSAVHFLPVFGEHGALLEHMVFDAVYNYPLTCRRRMRLRARARAGTPPRSWHTWIVAFLGTGLMVGAEQLYPGGPLPGLPQVWPLVVLVPSLAGVLVAIGAGGASVGRRIRLAMVCGAGLGAGSSLVHSFVEGAAAGATLSHAGWSIFLFALLATIAALIAETHTPEPKAAVNDEQLF